MNLSITQQKKQEFFIVFALVLLIFLPRVTNLGLFQGPDELMRNRQSSESFVAIAEGRWADVESYNFGGVNLTWAKTAQKLLQFGRLRLQGATITLAETIKYGPEFDPLPGAVFNALLLIILYWFLRRLFGVKTAVLATAMLALDPYLLSESRILRTEAAYALFFALATVSTAIYAQTWQRRYLGWASFWTAWTLATKISGVVLIPMIGGVVFAALWYKKEAVNNRWGQAKRLLIDGLIGVMGVAVSTFIIWPALWVIPGQTLVALYNSVVSWGFSQTLDYFFMGKIVPELSPIYYLLVLLFKLTPLTLMGLVILGGLWANRAVRRNLLLAKLSSLLPGGGILVGFGLVHIVFISAGTFKTERYAMVTAVVLVIAAATGLTIAGEMVYRWWRQKKLPPAVYWGSVLGIFFLGHGLFAWLNHPYYFSYYNPLLGGAPAAAAIVQVGSGEVLDRAIDYLNNKPNPQNQTVVCGTNLPRCQHVANGQTWLKQEVLGGGYSDWLTADYVITYIFQAQRRDYSPGIIAYLKEHPGAEYTVRFQGIDYAEVYPVPDVQYIVGDKLMGVSTLLGYNLNPSPAAAGELLQFGFYWENDGRIDQDMFVQLTDADHYVWAETTAPFLPGFEKLRTQRRAIIEGEAELSLPIGMPPGVYYLKMGYKTPSGELIGQFKLPVGTDTIAVSLPQTFTGQPSPAYPMQIMLNQELVLQGYTIKQHAIPAGEAEWLTLYWQTMADVSHDYVIALQLLDHTDKEVAYWLGRPIRSVLPTDQWQQGQIVQDPWRLTIPADLPAGSYQVMLTIYTAPAGEQVTAVNLLQVDIK